MSKPGDFFTIFKDYYKSLIETGSGIMAVYSFGRGLNLLDFGCSPTSIPYKWNNNFLNGLMAAYLHTKRISDPE
jgi:hypothetical protein